MTKTKMTEQEQIDFITSFLDEIKNDIITYKKDDIKDMDNIELSRFIAEIVNDCQYVKK